MTNSKTTKRALFSSVVALLLCFTMLLGTTYAWFTDSAVSGRNIIQSGNLDVVLEYKTKWSDDWALVKEDTKLFKEGALYEPGYTEVVFLRVSNAGSLALKYKLDVTVYGETKSTNVYDEEFSLKDHLEIGYYTQAEYNGTHNYADTLMPYMFGTRESSRNHVNNSGTGFKKLSATGSGSITEVTPVLAGDTTAQVVAIVLTMPETVGNEANHKTGVAAPTIDLGVTLLATQYTDEEDSFNNQYDKDALYPVIVIDEPWASNYTATEPYVVNGNGKTIKGIATNADAFTWTNNGTIPEMSNIFSSANGSKVTVNDLTFTGTMSSVMAGNYVAGSVADQSNFNTEFNNVNIVNAEVVSFSAGISPALTVYGTAVLNNCNVYGTTLSALDTNPMWPVYDIAAVNYSDLTVNDSKIGSIYMWNQAKVTVADGSEVSTIVIRGNMNNNNANNWLVINDGATVGTIDLSEITDVNRVKIEIEDGATFGGFVDNGITYATIEAWKNAQ